MTANDELLQRARQKARTNYAAQRQASLSPRPPAPGDLYRFDASSADAVEWALLEISAWPAPGRGLFVPADLQPMAGSRDFRLAAGEACGPLCLRCGHAVWLELNRLSEARRTGALSSTALAVAGDLVERIRGGEAEGGAVAGEVDADPEYRDWLTEQVEPARHALLQANSAGGAPDTNSLATMHRDPEQRRAVPHGRRRWLGLAAGALLSAGLAFSVAEWRQQNSPNLPADAPSVVLNPRLEWFQPQTDSLRDGASHEVQLPAEPGGRFVFVLETWSSQVFARYGAELWRVAGGNEERLWQSDQLSLQGASEVVVGLSAELLSPGEYRFQLHGIAAEATVTEDAVKPLESYRFRIAD